VTSAEGSAIALVLIFTQSEFGNKDDNLAIGRVDSDICLAGCDDDPIKHKDSSTEVLNLQSVLDFTSQNFAVLVNIGSEIHVIDISPRSISFQKGRLVHNATIDVTNLSEL